MMILHILSGPVSFLLDFTYYFYPVIELGAFFKFFKLYTIVTVRKAMSSIILIINFL